MHSAVTLLTAATIFFAGGSVSATDNDDFFSLEPIESLSLYDFWHSFPDPSFKAKNAPYLHHQIYDYESTVYDSERGVGVSILFFGNGDLAEIPFAIRIWAKETSSVTITEQDNNVRERSYGSKYFVTVTARDCDAGSCPKVTYDFRAEENTVYLEETVIGQITD